MEKASNEFTKLEDSFTKFKEIFDGPKRIENIMILLSNGFDNIIDEAIEKKQKDTLVKIYDNLNEKCKFITIHIEK